MHLYIIAQYMNIPGQMEDRLYILGRECIFRGHQVTVFTIASGTGFKLNGKMIGLAQKSGLPTVSFNIPYDVKMSNWNKMMAYLRFARLTTKQGRLLPPPDLIIAALPPLTAAIPALKLSKLFKVPLVVEIRELWPDAPQQRGSLTNKLLLKAARRLEKQVYEKADRIIASTPGIAEAVKERWVERAKIIVIPDQSEDKELVDRYESVLEGLVNPTKKPASGDRLKEV